MTALDCPVGKQAWRDEATRDGHFGESRPPVATKAVSDAGPWELAVEKIVGFQHLGEDWDGFGAAGPTQELLESAIGLAYLFAEKAVPPPSRVAPGVEGCVILEWQFQNGNYGVVEIVRPFFAEVMFMEAGKPAKHWTLPTE